MTQNEQVHLRLQILDLLMRSSGMTASGQPLSYQEKVLVAEYMYRWVCGGGDVSSKTDTDRSSHG